LEALVPERIAPFTIALSVMRPQGDGQIFGVRNNEIYLFNQPRPIRTAHSSDGWTPQTYRARVSDVQSSLTPLERSGQFPTRFVQANGAMQFELTLNRSMSRAIARDSPTTPIFAAL